MASKLASKSKRRWTFTFDVMGLVLLLGALGLMFGVISFTPVSVAVLLIIAKCSLTFTW